ncbi:MAG: metal-dependent transcriptional regulator [Tepidisphaeraceae bacterium]
MPTPTVENYVKTLYLEQQRCPDALVPLGKLTAAMGVVPGTVTTMVRTLADAGLVRYEPRIGVALTAAGNKLALHVLRRHRLVETFLVDVLKFDWSEVHTEAEELEHSISDKLLEKMDAFLGYPTTDPHGDPIPTAAGEIHRQELVLLTHCTAGERVRIVRVDKQDADFLNYADANGLRPGAEVQVLTADAIAGAMTLELGDGKHVALGISTAEAIWIARC